MTLNDPVLAQQAGAAVQAYMREKMYRLYHIPHRYFIPPEFGGQPEQLKRLTQELAEKGHIDLDRSGQPACLSGRPAVLAGDA